MSDPHVENKRLFEIDVALVGIQEACARWELWVPKISRWVSLRGHPGSSPSWVFPPEEYRRDPNAPPMPSMDWLDAPDWALRKAVFDKGAIWLQKGDATPSNAVAIETRPPEAWFELMRTTHPAPVADPTAMLTEDNRSLKTAGCNLAEAASRVIDTSDGVHRLAIAVAGWYKAIAGEGFRKERYGDG